jgi:atypical dual specificity phosphatase
VVRRPDYFLAFDIYDSALGKFYSREERDRALEGSGIRTVPLIAEGTFTKEQFAEFLNRDSVLYDGKVEGVYVRIDDGKYLVQRGKLVRADFSQEIDEHWTKKNLVKNIIVFE